MNQSTLSLRITLHPLVHRGQAQMRLDFPFDLALKDHLKQFSGVRWSQAHRCFYMEHSSDSIARLLRHIKGREV